MGASQYISSLSCELRITRAKNIELKQEGNLFVRYYLSAGNKQRVELSSQEISSKSDLFWNESFSLECLGTQESVQSLKQQTVVFELRWRKARRVLGKQSRSHLLGKAELPWKAVFESPDMEMEQWVTMASKSTSSVLEGGNKPPSVLVGMKVRVPVMALEIEKRRRNGCGLTKWNDDCGCRHDGRGCEHNDIFAIAAALEAF